ncbi:hypothetical protein BSZ39_03845 [Bowdeniella nasicola]|uniref:Lipoprotein n=1 Tax=Bowdeniella nasicola TaxID=208480 RepID=A0A1Q5Q3X2_9ACTO|nr:hypothetical protein [Bowdeniella nasicola]OKL54513.1 hypothetical protein BSZ39_03845 [Bowdeniella nasicola]
MQLRRTVFALGAALTLSLTACGGNGSSDPRALQNPVPLADEDPPEVKVVESWFYQDDEGIHVYAIVSGNDTKRLALTLGGAKWAVLMDNEEVQTADADYFMHWPGQEVLAHAHLPSLGRRAVSVKAAAAVVKLNKDASLDASVPPLPKAKASAITSVVLCKDAENNVAGFYKVTTEDVSPNATVTFPNDPQSMVAVPASCEAWNNYDG